MVITSANQGGFVCILASSGSHSPSSLESHAMVYLVFEAGFDGYEDDMALGIRIEKRVKVSTATDDFRTGTPAGRTARNSGQPRQRYDRYRHEWYSHRPIRLRRLWPWWLAVPRPTVCSPLPSLSTRSSPTYLDEPDLDNVLLRKLDQSRLHRLLRHPTPQGPMKMRRQPSSHPTDSSPRAKRRSTAASSRSSSRVSPSGRSL